MPESKPIMEINPGHPLVLWLKYEETRFAKTDAKDRHVAASAVAARKRSEVDIVTIITWNLGDFDRKELDQVGVAAETPDAFLCRPMPDSD